MTFLAALRCDAITAPCVFDGPINGESFLNYVEQILVPSLKPGDIVIMDNLGSHKSDAVRMAIRGVGGRLIFEPSRPHGEQSVNFSEPSPNRNAPTISSMQVTLPPKLSPL